MPMLQLLAFNTLGESGMLDVDENDEPLLLPFHKNQKSFWRLSKEGGTCMHEA